MRSKRPDISTGHNPENKSATPQVRRLQVNRSLAKWLVPSLFLIGLLGASAHAQISPGPLARAHKQLDSAAHCTDCHKLADKNQPKSKIPYPFADLSCTTCHEDIHHGQFKERQEKVGKEGKPMGCEACHGTKSWRELDGFDHNTTSFRLEGAHRGGNR